MVRTTSLWRRVVAGLAAITAAFGLARPAPAAEWQLSVPEGNGRAFLWIPPNCRQVRAVVLANHNMIEEGILEHASMRQTLGELGIAQVWVVPALDPTFDFNLTGNNAPTVRFERMMHALAETSGYEELATAPVVAMGHSASATFPWNFAASMPQRTLAVLSLKGDAPQTTLTGNGKPRVAWGERHVDGIPALMVMGEYEWWEDRAAPLFEYVQKHPGAAVSLVCDAGWGHFDASDRLVEYLALFIRKAAEARLPLDPASSALRVVDPRKGWRMDRWRPQGPASPAAAFDDYRGPVAEASWCFDREMAARTEALYAESRGKKPQLLGFVQDGRIVPQINTHEQVRLAFLPGEDGMGFDIQAVFLEAVPGGSANPAKWAGLPEGSPLGHAAAGAVEVSRITGPVKKAAANRFELCLDRSSNIDRRYLDVWLLASHPGDGQFKSAVQQALLRPVPHASGREQRITFPPIQDVAASTRAVTLRARSQIAGVEGGELPVRYFVREGPAEVVGDRLELLPLPPKSRLPVAVTVVAWQWGRGGTGVGAERQVRAAEPVERTFYIRGE